MNYTRVKELYGTDKFNIAPRYHKCFTQIKEFPIEGEHGINLMMWDTDREREINIGTSYPFDALKKQECILASSYQQKGFSVDDTIHISVDNMYGVWI